MVPKYRNCKTCGKVFVSGRLGQNCFKCDIRMVAQVKEESLEDLKLAKDLRRMKTELDDLLKEEP